MRSQFHIYLMPLLVAIIGILIIIYVQQKNAIEPFISLQELIQRNARIRETAAVQGAYNSVIGFMYKYPNNSHGIFKTMGESYFQSPCKYNLQWSRVLPPGKTKPLSPQTVTDANNAFRLWTQCINQKNATCIQQLSDFNQRFLQSCTLKADALKSPKNFGNVF